MSRRAVISAVTGVAVVAIVSGALVARGGADATTPGASSSDSSVQHVDGEAGAREEDDRSEPGARRAALRLAAASQDWLYLDDAGVDRAVRSIATTAAGDRLASEVMDEVRTAREALLSSPRVWWIVRPLATNVISSSPAVARVEVWVVAVLSATDAAAPQSDWRTLTFELRWERSEWRVADVEDVAGPTPTVGPRDRPWTAARLDAALEGYQRIEAEQ